MNKFMPPKPKEFANDDYYEPTLSKRDFNNWYDREIKPLFENAVEVYGNKGGPDRYNKWLYMEDKSDEDTHSALLINIQPIQPESADDILRELTDSLELVNPISAHMEAALKKARKFLESK